MSYPHWIKIFCLVLLIISFQQIYSQQNAYSCIGASFGASDFHLKDELSSPLIFSKTGIAPSINFMYKGPENRHFAEAQFYYANLTTVTANNLSTDNWRGSLRYTYVHSVFNQNSSFRRFEFFIGGSIRSFLNWSTYNFAWGSANSIAARSWYWSHSIDIAVEMDYRPFSNDGSENDCSTLSVLCYVPMISNVSRPTYSPSGDYNYDKNTREMKFFGDTEIFPKNFSFDAQVFYSVNMIKNLDLILSYEFYYSSYYTPKEFASYMNNFRTGLQYHF